MSILTVSNVAKSFGSEQLFSNVTFKIEAGQKMGLVGRNGCGKTTLLRILLGQEASDASPVSTADGTKMVQGRAALAAGRRLGYLRQEAPVHPEHTIMEEIQTVFAPVRVLEGEMAALEQAMTDAPDDASLEAAMNEYARVRDAFDAAGGYHYADDLDLVLQKLGFRPADMDKLVGACSGGEQTRLALAKIVLSRPDLLVLDEPTNHLDIASCEALTGMLSQYAGTLMLVSHDRYLLNATTTKTLVLPGAMGGEAGLFEGNYATWRDSTREAPPARSSRAEKPAVSAPKFNGTARAAVPAPAAPALNARELSKARVKARELVLTTEASVNALENRIASAEERLAKPSGSVGEMVALAAEHTRLQDDLMAALAAWEQAVSDQETLGE